MRFPANTRRFLAFCPRDLQRNFLTWCRKGLQNGWFYVKFTACTRRRCAPFVESDGNEDARYGVLSNTVLATDAQLRSLKPMPLTASDADWLDVPGLPSSRLRKPIYSISSGRPRRHYMCTGWPPAVLGRVDRRRRGA